MVLSSDHSLWSPMLRRVKHIVVKCARRVFANACTALLCLLLQRLSIYLFVQHGNKCRQLLFYFNVQRLHSGCKYGLNICFLRQFLGIFCTGVLGIV